MSRLLTVIFILAALLFAAGSAWAQDAAIEAPSEGLQTELTPVTAEYDWRAEAGLEETVRETGEAPDWLQWLARNFINILFGAFAVMILILILWVIIRQGSAGRFNLQAEAAKGERLSGDAAPEIAGVGGVRMTLDEILALEDLRTAIGALLRLTLEAALKLTGAALRRSATAREILRCLPADFAHLKAVAALVREAEAVRFGGAEISKDRFDELVALVRPLLSGKPAS